MPPEAEDPNDVASAASSPYSRARATIRSLTMPPIPNLNIPESPPGSPPLESTKKFTRFLELKKKGVHFNARLEESPALRNPAVLKRLTALAGIDDVDQYASALPKDLAVPPQFPPGAYFEELNRNQLRLLKKRDAERSKSRKIDFVKPSQNQTNGN
jgi:HCNGP-like protein